MDQDPTGGGARPDSGGASALDLSGRCVGGSAVLVRPIGRGTTGTVWRGVDRISGEPVAVKLLHDSPELVTRFVRERELLLMLRHRHVVRIRDLVSFGGSPGLVMDLVTGGSLPEHLRQHPTLEPAAAARLAARVAAALAGAHELGIIHRDLTPGNILLDRTGGELEPRVTDFGIARVLDTPGRTVVGTPNYLAPESFGSATVGPAADVYALGVLLHELVCGRTSYDGDRFPGPDRRPGIPDALWEIITRCLEQKPRLRPTAAELSADLSAVARATAGAPARPLIPAPVHPSLTGFKLPAPVRRNQPASWRWGNAFGR